MPRTAVYAGCFDPPTESALWIIREASRIFARLTVAVLEPTDWPFRERIFSLEERVALLRSALDGLDNVVVLPFARPLADSCVIAADADCLLNDQRQSCPFGFRETFDEGRGDGAGRSVVLIVPRSTGRSCHEVCRTVGDPGWQEDIRRDLPREV